MPGYSNTEPARVFLGDPMSSRRFVVRALLALLVAALVGPAALPTPPAVAAEPFGSTTRSYVVPTRHGKIYLEVVHPTRAGAVVRGPVVLTYTPYAVLGRNSGAAGLVSRGYVRATADVVGTGNSGGCFDYGGRRERESGYDIVEWIAAQPWSTGRVAMMGGSYEGTTAVAAAIEDPPHLTTIIPIAAISRWYEYAYSGGIRYLWNNEASGHQGPGSGADEGFDTPLAFDFGLALPPPLDPEDPDWAERVESSVKPCDELEHTQRGYDDTPDYGSFWMERDYIAAAENIDIPVLIGHNWGDWNVKQEEAWNLYQALTRSPRKVLYMGTRWDGHGSPGSRWNAAVTGWLDQYLRGVSTSDLPAVVSQTSTLAGAGDWYRGRYPTISPLTLFAQAQDGSGYRWTLDTTAPDAPASAPVASFRATGQNTEYGVNSKPRSNMSWLWFETPPLARDLRVFGRIRLRLLSATDREWITITPTVVDVDPEAYQTVGDQLVATEGTQLLSTTRGWLDSRYRGSLRRQQLVTPGDAFAMTVHLKPQDYTFEKGHRIGLAIQTEIAEWNVPKVAACSGPGCPEVRVVWRKGQTHLVLPVFGSVNPATLFE